MDATGPTVFVVDDEPSIRRAVAALMSSKGMRCETFASAEEFLRDYDPSREGCLVVDLRLGGMTGLELYERLAAAGNSPATIVLSAYVDVPTAVHAMKHGAVTVLTKPCHPTQLSDAICAAIEADCKSRKDCTRRREVRGRVETLTPRERQAMARIVAGEANKLIARRMGISQRTVDRLRAAVFRKMGVETAVGLARMLGEWRASCRAQNESVRTCSEPGLGEVIVDGPHDPFGAPGSVSQPSA